MDAARIPHRVHLVGVAGEGMAAIAEYLLDAGHAVSGSDARLTPDTERLVRRGATIHHGHHPLNLAGAGMVVVSDAVPASNVECAEARLLDLPVMRRASLLALIARTRRSICVAGSHGKSTTTAMIATILDTAGLHPGFVVGARVDALGGRRASSGAGEWLVVEACEAFSNLAPFVPDVAVITNIDDDHLEHYGSQARLDAAFADFVSRAVPDGWAVLNGDDDGVKRAIAGTAAPCLTFGFGAANDVRIADYEAGPSGSTFTIAGRGVGQLRVRLTIPGRHVAMNAAAAAGVCLRLGVPADEIVRGLQAFSGVESRWQDHGDAGGVRLIQDYAHHPTEVSAVLAAARSAIAPDRRLVIAFQPQLVSRTRRLYRRFADALSAADQVLLLEIDPGGEPVDPDVQSATIADELQRLGIPVELLPGVDDLVNHVTRIVRPGDFLLLAGAGTIRRAATAVQRELLLSRAHDGGIGDDMAVFALAGSAALSVAAARSSTTNSAASSLVPAAAAQARRGGATLRDSEPPARRLRRGVLSTLASWSPRSRTPADLFRAVVNSRPDAPSIDAAGRTLTYRELDAASDHGAMLLRDRGVRRGSVVAVCLPSSLELVACVVALAKLGAVYLPVDPTIPADRARFMTDAAGAVLAVAGAESALGSNESSIDVVEADEFRAAAFAIAAAADASSLEHDETGTPRGRARSEAAYICFTSGSTGAPKGVLIAQASLVAFLQAVSGRFGIGPAARVALNTAIGFDVSIGELWMTLAAGGCLCVTGAAKPLVGYRLADFLERSQVTHLAVTPSVLRSVPPRDLPSLRCVIAAGEVCPPELVDRWARTRAFFNAYGPTEATIYATVARCEAGEPVTIGQPLDHVHAYVMDDALRPAAPGAVGELWLGGRGIARGYLKGRADDDRRFRPLQRFGVAVDRIYRTGDLVRAGADGGLTFVGRLDHQVKVLGNRIELEEIEATILTDSGVADATVGVNAVGDFAELVAFVVGRQGATPDIDAIGSQVSRWLPAHMVPAHFVVVPETPLTPSGKKDRARLVDEFRTMRIRRPFFSPGRTDVEVRLARVWQDVLCPGHEVGVYDEFASLGGDSLKSLLLIAATEEAFAIAIPPGYFERFTNVANMAVLVEELLWTRSAAAMATEEGFYATRIYQQQRHLTASWGGERVSDRGLIRSFGRPDAAVDLFVCTQSEHEILALHEQFGPDVRVHGMRSGHLVMAYTESNVELLAGHYLEELQKIGPGGRIVIAGVCQGGTIAVALARKLRCVGRSPSLVMLVEQSRLPAVDGRVAFFYSRGSFLNPGARFDDGEARFARVYGDRYSVDLIEGSHGNLFELPQVQTLASRMTARIHAAG